MSTVMEPQKDARVPLMNQEVAWYRYADRSRDPLSARVSKIGRDVTGQVVLEVVTIGEGTKRSVRHIDDPFLESHSHWRHDYGAWDWTEQHKQQEAMEQRREELLAMMSEDLAEFRRDVHKLKIRMTALEKGEAPPK